MKNLSHLFRPSCPGTLSLFLSAALVGICGPASAAFFQLAENNASGIGNAFAGGAAIAEDASTMWYNPAGLTRLSGSQLVVSGHFIKPSTEFNKTSATTVTYPVIGARTISGGNGGDAGEDAVVPNIYYTQLLTERLFLGIGINAPFGLATDYEDSWVGRYHADRSEIITKNLNVGLGFKVSDGFSVGGGINYQTLDAELSQAVDFAGICTTSAATAVCGATAGFFPGAGTNDGTANVTADDDAWGYNLGFLWQLQKETRLGLAYRSKMKFELAGNFDITAPSNVPGAVLTGGGLVDSGVLANVTLPATLSVSAYHKLSSNWALMGDITRTFWSKLPELRIDFDSTQADSVVTLELKDVNRYSIGTTYTPGGNWSYRAGVALDQSPTPSAESRTPRLPDADRLWLAFGANYRASQSLGVDVGFVHIKIDDAEVNKSSGPLTSPAGENMFRGNLVGSYDATVQILSVQANWKF